MQFVCVLNINMALIICCKSKSGIVYYVMKRAKHHYDYAVRSCKIQVFVSLDFAYLKFLYVLSLISILKNP